MRTMNTPKRSLVLLFLLSVPTCSDPLLAQIPEWIWHDNRGQAPADNEVRFFRKAFMVDGALDKALLTAAGDDHVRIFLNGKQVLENDDWQKADAVDVTVEIKPGENVIAARGQNDASFAGFIAKLDLSLKGGNKGTVVTDTSWVSSDREAPGWEKPGFIAAGWTPSRSFGKLGAQPWGDVMAGAIVKGLGASKQATPAESLATPPGFRIAYRPAVP